TGTLTQSGNTLTLANVKSGTYTVRVTDTATGCFKDGTVVITQPAIALSASVVKVNANCNVATSKVTVTPAGGTASYTYAFKQDGVAPMATDYVASNVDNLNPTTNSNWDVWVKDANGCTFKLDVAIVKDPTPSITASAVGQCLGVGSYTITANGTGGTGTLTYSIDAGASYQAGTTFVVTTSGSYIIRVKDGNGCTADSAPVIVAPQLTLSAVLNKNITCSAPTAAQITLTATGGTGPFTYQYKEAAGVLTAMASNVFNSNTAGSYTFKVTDTATGCTAVTTTGIAITTPVNPDITAVSQTETIKCNGDSTAAITITVDNTKGLAPFVFNVLNTTTGTNYGTQTAGLAAGNYTITVTDAKGCTDTFPYVINQPLAITFDLTKVDITCNNPGGTSLGSISVGNVAGGTAPFKYFITNNFGDVIAGNPFSAVTNENHTFTIINYGLYTVDVVDANGCSLSKQITIASPPSDLTIDISSFTSNCTTGGTAVVKVVSLVGSHNYEFAILQTNVAPYAPPAAYFPADGGTPDVRTFTGLTPGVIYTFVVHDLTTNCYYVKSADFPIAPASTLTSTTVPNNVTCKGANNGSVTFTISNFDATTTSVNYRIYKAFSNVAVGASVNVPVTFGVPKTVTSPSPGTLAPGRYYVEFIENGSGAFNGCKSASAPFDILESSIDLSVLASSTKKANCTDLGIILAQAKNGTAPYKYQVTSSAVFPLATDPSWVTGNTFTKVGSIGGTPYYVYAKDAYGCIKQTTVTVFKDVDPTITAPAPICYDGSTAFNISITGTVDPLIVGAASYSVNGSAFQASPNFTFNAAGTYNLVIKDGNGCSANVNYKVYPKLQLSAALTTALDCIGSPDAVITLSTTGGNTTPAANYTYEVNKGAGFVTAANPYTATTAGTYVFRVTDANNAAVCQATKTFVLDPIPTTVFTTTQTHVSCNGGTDGTITVNVTAGEGPYEYQLNTGSFQTLNEFVGLAAGTTYVVTVRNARKCTLASVAITITQPAVLAATSAITTPLTCGAGNVAQPATVTVTATPGTGTSPYTYSFDGGNNYSSTNTYQSYVGTTFNVYVKDAKGCIVTLTNGVNIPALVAPTDLTFSTTVPVTCLVNGTVVITGHTGGVGTLQYETIAPSPVIRGPQTTTTFANLTPGTYLFKVTDANGCTYQESYIVQPVTNITVAGQLVSDVTCNETPAVSNGAVTFTVGNVKTSGAFTYVFLQGSGGTIVKTTNAVTL
ncbi:SprB repeat-containing protein, partial [Flavobacterium taihuense]